MIQKILDVDLEKAADIVALRCSRVSSDERREMLDSESFSEIINEKKEVAAIANTLDKTEKEADECCEVVREARVRV